MRKSSVFLALAFASACLGANAAGAATGRITLESGGVKRSATIVENVRLKKKRRPIVVVLRANQTSTIRMPRRLGIEEVSRAVAPVLIYPDAQDRTWTDQPGPAFDRDAAFIRDLVARVVQQGQGDPRRVYLVGAGGGGMTAMRIACASKDYAALAVAITALPVDLAASCQPSAPLPFLLISGTSDPLVPYDGGKVKLRGSAADVVSAEATLGVFARAAGCSDKPRATNPLPDRDRADGTRITVEKFTGCKAPVEFYRVEGGGHTLPGRWNQADSGAVLGARNNDIDAARVFWDFLQKQRR
jgi:polyhydroxybutyrate depolymerase